MIGRLGLVLCAGAACHDPPPGGAPDAALAIDAASPAGCPLTASGRALLEEMVHEIAFELLVAVGSGPYERHVAHTLPGVSVEQFIFFNLDEECGEPSESVTCASELGDDGGPFMIRHDACSRLLCRATGLAAMESYWTMRPPGEPGEPDPLRWRTTAPAGSAVSDSSWFIAWELDMTTNGTTRVTADIDRALVLVPDDDGALELGHVGSLAASETAEGGLSGSIEIDLPRLADRAIFIQGQLGSDPDAADHAVVTGTINHGDEPLADFDGRLSAEDRPAVEWQEACR